MSPPSIAPRRFAFASPPRVSFAPQDFGAHFLELFPRFCFEKCLPNQWRHPYVWNELTVVEDARRCAFAYEARGERGGFHVAAYQA